MADEFKPVTITWKKDEKWLAEYAWKHSSPSAWFKDLAIKEYKREKAEEQPTNQSPGIFNFLDD